MKVIINEASIRRDLRLDNVEGTACLPNAAIFEELARMSWDLGQMHMERSGLGVGTVPVSCRCMGSSMGEGVILARKEVRGHCLSRWGLKVWQVPWNELDLPDFTMIEQVYLLVCFVDKVECKKLKNELEEARFSNTFRRMQNERVERDLCWTRVRAHEFYQEMICRGFMFKERPNKAINVLIEDKKSPSSEPRGSPHDP
nr:hypothetical protein [Tanacetum cinerariifolium]